MSLVSAEGTYDAVLQDREVNPTIELGLILATVEQDGDTIKAWSESRVPPIPPRRSAGALSWTHKDPLTDFVFAQDDWSDGAFRPYYRDLDKRYANSNGVDLRWEGVATLGPKLGTPRSSTPNNAGITSNFLIADGTFEEGVTSAWSAGTGATYTVESAATNIRTGNYAANVVVAQSTSAGDIISQTLQNPTVYRSRTITVIAYVRRVAGSDSGILLRIADDVGSNDSSTITSSAYSYVSATRTIDANATSVTISIRHSATTTNAAHTFNIDDIHVIPAGGTECVGTAIRGSTTPDEAYAAIGRVVAYWDESSVRWSAGFIHASAVATDMEELNDTIHVAFGDSVTGSQYITGSTTSWTVAAINATTNHQDNHARFFVKSRNGYGNWALWKAGPSTAGGTETNAVQWSTDPSNAGSWNPATAFVVGSASRDITGLHEFSDSFVVTKVDGIWLWDASVVDFTNITQEWEHSVDAENGKRGQYWNGSLYLSAVRQGFYQFTSSGLIDLSDILLAPRLTDFGGRITAMVGGARELWIGLDQPTADTTVGKTSRLVTYSIVNGRPRLHTLHELGIGRIDALVFHRDVRLWALGRSYDSNLGDFFLSTALCFQPDKVAAPFADASPLVHHTGTLDLSIWHGNAPEGDKAFIGFTIWCEDLDTEHTIQVDFGADGRLPNTRRLGIFRSSDRIQTIYFKNIEDPQTNAVGRFIHIRLTFATDDTTAPKLYAFALHTQLVPDPIRVWDIAVAVGDKTLLRTGVPLDKNKAEILGLFDELEAQVFPITLIEDFGQSHRGLDADGARAHQVRLLHYAKRPTDDDEIGEEVWQLRLQEVPIDG